MTLRCIPTTFTVVHGPAWDAWGDDAYNGDVTIERTGHGDEDAWAIRSRVSRASRKALTWRRKYPDAPVTMPDDRLADLPPERRGIVEAFEHEMSPSSRTDAWKRNHTFTLAEALYVCGAAIDP